MDGCWVGIVSAGRGGLGQEDDVQTYQVKNGLAVLLDVLHLEQAHDVDALTEHLQQADLAQCCGRNTLLLHLPSANTSLSVVPTRCEKHV